jgi:hypothetical protein
MKKNRALTFVLASLILTGCGETNEVTLYLQDLNVRGPSGNLPLQLTRDPGEGEFHVTPHVGLPGSVSADGFHDGHTPVNGQGVFQVDTVYNGYAVSFTDRGINANTFSGKNLHRQFPSAMVGLDVDYGVSRLIAFSFGAHYSTVGSTGLTGYHAGIAFRQQKGNTGVRFDVGWQWEEFLYDAYTVVTERPLSSQSSTVSFYQDRGKSRQGEFYAALTVNSANPGWYLKPFLQLGITRQGISDIRPAAPQMETWVIPPFFVTSLSPSIVNDKRREFTSTQFIITPGISTDLDESLSIIVGLTLDVETNIEEYSRSTMLVPVIRLDWRL